MTLEEFKTEEVQKVVPKPTDEDDSDGDNVSELPVPPDGGWGWMVVIASFLIHVIADGVAYSFGILMVDLIKNFEADRAEVGWIGSLMAGMTYTSGPLSSALTNKFGCRAVTCLGSVIASFAFAISYFATSIYHLFFTMGILCGIGLGMIYLPAIVSVTFYFEKKRAFATGLAVCGSGVGTFSLSPLIKYLVEIYSWRGACLIISGLLLNCSVLGALFRPLEAKKVKKRSKDQDGAGESMLSKTNGYNTNHNVSNNGKEMSKGNSLDTRKSDVNIIITQERHRQRSGSAQSLPFASQQLHVSLEPQADIKRHQSAMLLEGEPRKKSKESVKGPLYRKDIFYSASLLNIPMYRSNPSLYAQSLVSISPRKEEGEDEKTCCPREFKDSCHQMMDLTLLHNPLFLMFAISNFFTSTGFNVPFMFLPDRAALLGIDGATIIVALGIGNTFGRIFFGWLSDKPFVNKLMLYNTALLMCGICTALSPFCVTLEWLAGYAAAFGIFVGVYVSLTSVVLVDLLGLEKLTSSFGLLLAFQGIATLMGGPAAGFLYDSTQNYHATFISTGTMIALSGAMLYAIPCVRKRYEKDIVVTQKEIDLGKKCSSQGQIGITDKDRTLMA